MALLHSRQSSTSSDISTDRYSEESTPSDAMPPDPVSSPAMASALNKFMDSSLYSDSDIRIMYDIVMRAEKYLADDTPTSRLPTHALFKAYREVLPEYGIDPDNDQLLSGLVFIVGGVKNTDSLTERFKVIMSRLGITIQMDGQPYGSEAGDAATNSAYASDELSIDGTEDLRYVANKNAPKKALRIVSSEHRHEVPNSHFQRRDDTADETMSDVDHPDNLSKMEQHLESSAIAFQQKHHSKFSAVNTFRQWQTKSNFIDTLCNQFDAARQADLEDDVEAKFEEWRAISTEVNDMPWQNLPPNVYSKRMEKIAIRAREIHTTKTAFRRWRQSARDQNRNAQDMEHSSDPLERIIAKAHKNLMLSRAFTNWSNRLEEESEKAQAAAKVYEMSLKSKAFGIRRRPADSIRVGEVHIVQTEPSPVSPAALDDAPRPSLAHSDRGGSEVAEDSISPGTVIAIREKVPPEASTKNISANDDSGDSDDEMDEMTLLARRHILRMRYYDVWERYTAENLNKVNDFSAAQQDERIAHAIPIWRSQAEQVSQERDTQQYNAARASYYYKAVKAVDVWRQESQAKTQGEDQLLGHYAARANFYYKANKALPMWRTENERAVNQQGVLELYANRAEYYYKATKTLPIWRAQAQQVAEHEEQTLKCYAERADYYYKTRDTLLSWHDLAKKKRKQRLKEAHLETRRIVKKGMGERCIAQWREKLQPSFDRFETMNSILEDVDADRDLMHSMEALDTWRERARERGEMAGMSKAMVQEKALEKWRDKSTYHEELHNEAREHWKETAMPRALKSWNLSTLQVPNRPLIVSNALEKKDRRLLRTGFEGWYKRTADKLVPVELADGGYKSVERVVEDAQRQASLNQARGLFDKWKETAKSRSESVQQNTYTPTPGRRRIFFGPLGRRETTTPLAPVPSRMNWRASDTALRSSALRGRANRSDRPERNLRVSWAQ
ncbi:hypothetical protein M426DRAFT_11468 [Hypoxylon sp. CI-4A]|nr:hypothetical protein M426DRAFT_11468 [Hypoxylon sp. CI-4A]